VFPLDSPEAIVILSAEVRWFWRDACPRETERRFRDGPAFPFIPAGGGEEPRVDRYFHAKGATDIGVKVRGQRAGESDGVEIKGLVAVLEPPEVAGGCAIGFPIQIWGKWSAARLTAEQSMVTRKQRWMRRYRVAGRGVEELPHNGKAAVPETGCNLELTRVDVEGRPQAWWTLGFEAFGDLRSAPEALAATFGFLSGNRPLPPLDGERLSYPEWLDRL
jgi:hypothetical protein